MSLYETLYGSGSLNERVLLLVNHANSPFLDRLMEGATFLGGSRLVYLYAVILLILCLANRQKFPFRLLGVYLLAVLLADLAENFLKGFFAVPRPPAALGLDRVRALGHISKSFSLPSGHAVFSFTTATVLAYRRGPLWKTPLFLLALLVCYSRVYLGMHYPLDVAAGAITGAACALLVWKGWEAVEASRRPRSGCRTDATPGK